MNREELITKHMSYAVHLASEFIKCFPKYKYLRDDLISEGYVGLIEGVDASEGDPTKTYLSSWILKRIGEFAAESHMIPIPPETMRRKKIYPPTVDQVDTEELDKICSNLNLTAYEDAYNNILSYCTTEEERTIVWMRSNRQKDPEIAATLGLAVVTVYMLRREIYSRYLSDNEHLRGEA